MIEDLIERVFATRNAAHIAHWKTKSYAEHQALGSFYGSVIDVLDKLVEAHQGIIGLVNVGALAEQPKVKDIAIQLMDDYAFITHSRKAIMDGLPAVDNILQEMEGIYATTLYKLKNLS